MSDERGETRAVRAKLYSYPVENNSVSGGKGGGSGGGEEHPSPASRHGFPSRKEAESLRSLRKKGAGLSVNLEEKRRGAIDY